MFDLKPIHKEGKVVEFKYNKQRLQKSVEWVEKNVAEAIYKYKLEYLFDATKEEIEAFITELDRKFKRPSTGQHPDDQGYQVRHIRQHITNKFDELDLNAIAAKVKGGKPIVNSKVENKDESKTKKQVPGK